MRLLAAIVALAAIPAMAAEPPINPDPLTPQQLAFHELIVSVPGPGRYEMALLAGGEEIGRQPLLIGSASALTRSDFD
jgi:hypothetical protein